MTAQNYETPKLKVISLGGWSGVTQNLFVYETENDIILVDCGIGFPKDSQSETVLTPDVSYLQKKQNKIRGIIISHGHLDHFGALPFIWPQIGRPPIFASRLVEAFIKSRMAEYDFSSVEVGPMRLDVGIEKATFRLGSFEITPFRVNHSVPDSVGLCLKTPVGKIFHVSDYKFDFTPVDGKVFAVQQVARLAQPQPLALLADCLGAVDPGFTDSEREIKNIFNQIIGEAKGQVFVTTLSSNISRFQQAISVALRHGRRIVLVGRSVEEKIEIARKLGYLQLSPKDIVSVQKAAKLPQNRLVYLIAGSYGQANSALSRLAKNDYRSVRLEQGAVVVFSADPSPPGSREAVDALVDRLTLKGAKVHYYEIQENLHVSGHGSAGNQRLLLSLIKPRFYVPIGGDPRHIRAASLLARDIGFGKNLIFELFKGEILEFSSNDAQVRGEVAIKEIAQEQRR